MSSYDDLDRAIQVARSPYPPGTALGELARRVMNDRRREVTAAPTSSPLPPVSESPAALAARVGSQRVSREQIQRLAEALVGPGPSVDDGNNGIGRFAPVEAETLPSPSLDESAAEAIRHTLIDRSAYPSLARALAKRNALVAQRGIEPQYKQFVPAASRVVEALTPEWATQAELRGVEPGYSGKTPQARRDITDILVGATMDAASLASGGGIAKGAAAGATRAAQGAPPVVRRALARLGGFHVDRPRLYHGTAIQEGEEFRGFDLARAGSMTGAHTAKTGIWAAAQPEYANDMAMLAAKRTGGYPAVIPLVYRSESPATLRIRGEADERAVAAWDDGYTSVRILHTVKPGKVEETWVFRDPSQLRSPFAKFDPKKRESGDLLAGIGGAGVVGAAVSQDNY